MRKTTILGFCITALVAFAAWAPNATAYSIGGNCATCHEFSGGPGDATHDFHTSFTGCSSCHVRTGDNPVVADSCANCHDGEPLRDFHEIQQQVSCGTSTVGCHAPPPPPEETNCSDGIDNNNNGLTDCVDPDCDGFVFVGQETTCGEGACAATGNLECRNSGQEDTCQPGSPAAEGPFGNASCDDGIDNDCDGSTDASDSDCAAPPEVCDDGLDNNGNGLADCTDPQCDGFAFSDVTTCGQGACASTGSVICQNYVEFDTCDPFTPGSEGPFGDASCDDGIDNDCDGSTDANDSDCATPPEVCDDGLDNNGNGLFDCADPQCDGFAFSDVTNCGQGACAATGNLECSNLGQVDTCQPGAPGNEGPYGDPNCSDGIDNDCNNQTDDTDTNCQAGPETCDNNIDDNGDGLVDCADPQCNGFVGQPGSCTTSLPGICSAGTFSCDLGETFCDQDTEAVTEGPFTSPTCNDGEDNDCDGLTDAIDPDCNAPAENCEDGVDNNSDDLADCEDPQCAGITFGACDTGNPGICSNGTLTCDGSSIGPVCEQDQAAQAEGPAGSPSCNDGLDNNCNGLTDADDPDCETSVCSDGNELIITEAEYNRGDEKLHIKGRAASGTTLTIINSDTDKVLAEGIRVREGKWEVEIEHVGSALLHISVISSNGCVVNQEFKTETKNRDDRYERHKNSKRKRRHTRSDD